MKKKLLYNEQGTLQLFKRTPIEDISPDKAKKKKKKKSK